MVLIVLLGATVGGCLSTPNPPILLIPHGWAHEVDGNETVRVLARIANMGNGMILKGVSTIGIYVYGPGLDQLWSDPRLGEPLEPVPARQSVVVERQVGGWPAERTHFYYRIATEDRGTQALFTAFSACYELVTAAQVTADCAPTASGNGRPGTIPGPDEPHWQAKLKECCNWTHRPAELYFPECVATLRTVTPVITCTFTPANIDPSPGVIRGRMELFVNGSSGNVAARDFETPILQPRQAKTMTVEIELSGQLPTGVGELGARIKVWPAGREAEAATEVAWVRNATLPG